MDLVKVRDKETGEEFATLDRWVDTNHEVIGGPETLTAEQIAEVLASDAENNNYHEFVPFFSKLARIVADAAGPVVAAKVLLTLAQDGGFRSW